MKIRTVIIGEYQISPAVSFSLYQLPSPIVTPPRSLNQEQRYEHFINYFCLEDLFAIFDLAACQHLIQYYQQNPHYFCKDESGRSYIQSHAMAEIALANNLCALADLCRLEDDELLVGGAIPLLKMTTCVRLLANPSMMIIEFEPRRLDGSEWFFHQHPRVKLESTRLHRLSSDTSCSSIMSHPEVNAPIKPSSLLLKRLAPKHGHKKNLTIMTPSYNEESIAHGVKSAPLRKSVAGKVVKKSPPLTASIKNSTRRLAVPATASAVTAPWPQTSAQSRFPSPPIVPSQQPTWNHQRQSKPMRPAIKTATLACFPRTPTTATFHMTQKQKFLQPFEFLYDHIEQTRTLKTTLDDQIRRSSSLMQTLQSSGTMIESLVCQQVRDMVDQKFQDRLRECTERIGQLEYRVPLTKDIPISPAVSPSPSDKVSTSKEPIQQQHLLTQLMNRIDQLESKLVNKTA